MSKVDAILLAGAPADAQMSPEGTRTSRAMVRIGDKTMLQWVVDALRASPSIGRIVAVGDVAGDGLDIVIDPGESLVSNMRSGIEALETNERVLIVSSDIPLLTAEAVEDFVGKAEPLGVDMAYPVIERSQCEARYPGIKRTYLKTADGVFTGGNIMLVSPEFVSRNWETISGAYAARKHVSQLARMIGVGVFLRVIIAQVIPSVLTLSALERAASRMLGASLQAVVSAYPEIGEDVDKPSDLEAVRVLLASGGK